ncbi:MAG: hypothetical protein FWG83_00065 [Oscillospiraceae bacterium]|nr:hypothetical protein [Oscillospiraceae bacterium]
MAQVDTRHAEKDKLFSLMLAEFTGDFKSLIASTRAKMEKEDIEDVVQEFERFKKSLNN